MVMMAISSLLRLSLYGQICPKSNNFRVSILPCPSLPIGPVSTPYDL